MTSQNNILLEPNPWLRRLGAAMRVLGVFGIVASAFLFVGLLFVPAQVIPLAEDATTSTADALRTISDSMEATSSSLVAASDVLDSAGSTLLSISNTVKNTKPLLTSAAGVVGDVGKNTLEKTNQALESAQSAATAVDGVLRALAFLPIGINYDPESSLGDSLADVADGLAPLPEGLIDISEKIYDTAEGFDEVSGGLDQTGGDIQNLSADVGELGEQLGTLATSLATQADNLDELVEKIPTIVWTSAVVLELFVLGVLFAQVTVILVGTRLYRENAQEE